MNIAGPEKIFSRNYLAGFEKKEKTIESSLSKYVRNSYQE